MSVRPGGHQSKPMSHKLDPRKARMNVAQGARLLNWKVPKESPNETYNSSCNLASEDDCEIAEEEIE